MLLNPNLLLSVGGFLASLRTELALAANISLIARAKETDATMTVFPSYFSSLNEVTSALVSSATSRIASSLSVMSPGISSAHSAVPASSSASASSSISANSAGMGATSTQGAAAVLSLASRNAPNSTFFPAPFFSRHYNELNAISQVHQHSSRKRKLRRASHSHSPSSSPSPLLLSFSVHPLISTSAIFLDLVPTQSRSWAELAYELSPSMHVRAISSCYLTGLWLYDSTGGMYDHKSLSLVSPAEKSHSGAGALTGAGAGASAVHRGFSVFAMEKNTKNRNTHEILRNIEFDLQNPNKFVKNYPQPDRYDFISSQITELNHAFGLTNLRVVPLVRTDDGIYYTFNGCVIDDNTLQNAGLSIIKLSSNQEKTLQYHTLVLKDLRQSIQLRGSHDLTVSVPVDVKHSLCHIFNYFLV